MDAADKAAHNTVIRSIGKLEKKLDELVTVQQETRDAVVVMTGDMVYVKRDLGELRTQVREMNGTLRRHDTDISKLQEFCNDRVKPALERIGDIRVELAKLGALGGGLSIIGGAIAGIGKAAGWW